MTAVYHAKSGHPGGSLSSADIMTFLYFEEMLVNPEKFRAFGFETMEIDGHDFDQIREAFAAARACKGKPFCIVAKTHKGRGVSFMTDKAGWHGKAPNDEEYQTAMADLEKGGAE